MKKIVVLNRITLDGMFDGPNGEQDWFIPGDEENKAAHEIGVPVDSLLIGRLTYQNLAKFWPTVTDDSNFPQAAKTQAKEINEMPKYVFSRTLKNLTWENSKLITGDLLSEVQKLKQGDGPGMLILGSGTIIQQLTEAGLIDHYVFILTPTVLGKGKPQFKQDQKVDLELVESRSFKSGNMILHYQRK
ncbi:MAG: dihydrofolate reductase family protein [Chloroflexota bacterium]